MASYSKKIEIKINYEDADDSRKKMKELNLKASSYTINGLDATMEVTLDGKTIVVSAKWLKEACEKAIQLHNIIYGKQR